MYLNTSNQPTFFLPDLQTFKTKEFLIPNKTKKAEQPLSKVKTKAPKLKRPAQNNFPIFTKNITSKINTNLREDSSFSEYPDVKFEPFTWSNSTTLQAGFFTLPKLSNHSSQSPVIRAQKERSLSYNRKHQVKYCEKIDEVPDCSAKPLKKFSKVPSPWKFQLATFITPSDT